MTLPPKNVSLAERLNFGQGERKCQRAVGRSTRWSSRSRRFKGNRCHCRSEVPGLTSRSSSVLTTRGSTEKLVLALDKWSLIDRRIGEEMN